MLNKKSSIVNVLFSKVNQMNMSDRIKSARIASGLSQESLGRQVGVTKGAVSQWESGNTKNLRLDNLFNIENATGFCAKWIAIGEGPERVSSLNKVLSPEEFKQGLDKLSDADLAILLKSIADRL